MKMKLDIEARPSRVRVRDLVTGDTFMIQDDDASLYIKLSDDFDWNAVKLPAGTAMEFGPEVPVTRVRVEAKVVADPDQSRSEPEWPPAGPYELEFQPDGKQAIANVRKTSIGFFDKHYTDEEAVATFAGKSAVFWITRQFKDKNPNYRAEACRRAFDELRYKIGDFSLGYRYNSHKDCK